MDCLTRTALALTWLLLVAGQTPAALVHYAFRGTVVNPWEVPSGGPASGDTVTGTFSYNPAAPAEPDGLTFRSAGHIAFEVGGVALRTDPSFPLLLGFHPGSG